MPQIINTITKTTQLDNFAVVNDTDLGGGFRSVSGLIDRNNIVSNQLKEGMIVYVRENAHYYKLSNSYTWIDLGNNLGGVGLSGNVTVNQGDLVISGAIGVNGVVFPDGSVQVTSASNYNVNLRAYFNNTTDWTYSNETYYIDAVHNFDSNYLLIQIVDTSVNEYIEVEKKIISSNIVRMIVPSSPDLRFSGTIFIVAN